MEPLLELTDFLFDESKNTDIKLDFFNCLQSSAIQQIN